MKSGEGLVTSIARFSLLLESKLRTELTNARAADRACDDTEVDRVLKITVRIREVNGIEHVEEIEPKFEAHSFVDTRVLCETQIEPMLKRAAERVAAEVAETAASRTEA